MSCTEVQPGVIVCRYDTWPIRRVLKCPVCHQRRRVIGRDRGAWYDVLWTCCGCGDSWADGELLPRPFRRGWRKEAIADARRRWLAAGPFDREAHWAWLRAQIDADAEVAPPDGAQ